MQGDQEQSNYPVKGQWAVLVPSNIKAGMTGVVNALQDHKGRITLTYSDQSTESTPPKQRALIVNDEPNWDWFELVSHVQSFRTE